MILEELARFGARPAGALPDPVVAAAVASFVDTAGVIVQGSATPVGQIALRYALDTGPGDSLLAAGGARSPAIASLANATAAHAQDFDDATTQVLSGHVSAVLVPVAFAVGQATGASGADLIEAYVHGYEVVIALARGVNPYHYEIGFHPTGTLGTFGAAVTAARLLGLTERQTTHALGIAASFASGIKANFGTMTKPLHCGWSAHGGVVAALLAQHGQESNPGAYEAGQGFGPLYGGPDWRTDEVLAGLGTDWALVNPGVTLRKLWPCCGSLLTTIEAAQNLVDGQPVDPDDILGLDCGVHERRLPHTNRPDAKTGDEGRFSLQYVFAACALGRRMTEDDFTDQAVSDPVVQALMSRTTVVGDPRQTGRTTLMDGKDFGAVVRMRLRDGRTRESVVDFPRGSSARPLTMTEIATKFDQCVAPRLGQSRSDEILRQLQALPDLPDSRSIRFDAEGATDARDIAS